MFKDLCPILLNQIELGNCHNDHHKQKNKTINGKFLI